MTVAGPKERQIAELRRRRALPPHVDHLLADGCPPELVILPGEPRNRRPKIERRRADAGVALAPPLAVQKAIAADLKDEPEPRASDATARAMIDAVDGPKKAAPTESVADQEELMTTKSKKRATKTAAKAKARTPVKAKTEGVRPGSKLEIVAGLLTRKEGCTTADVLKATGWPAVSMPQQAKAAGLMLKKEKNKGEPTRYWGSPRAA